MKGSTALLLLMPLAACSPKTETIASAPLKLDCGQPFEAQAAAVKAQPGLAPAVHEPGEPYWFYSTADGQVSYVITEPGAPGHPAIIRQDASGGATKTTGCAYGNKLGYQQLQTYVESLKGIARR